MLVGQRRACCDFFADATWRCGPFYMSSGQLDPIRIYFAALHQNKSENYCLMPTVSAARKACV